MPLIQVFTSSTAPSGDGRESLLRELSGALASHFGKPEKWVMTCILSNLAMTFGGTPAPTCFAAVKNVGKLTEEHAARISADLTKRLARGLGVEEERVYIELVEAEGRLWGWNGETFA